MTKIVLFVAAVLAVSGCASDSRCYSNAGYRKAESITPIQGTGDLQLPESPAALRIPPLSDAARAAAAQPVENGGGRRSSCLDVPPGLPPPEAEAAAK